MRQKWAVRYSWPWCEKRARRPIPLPFWSAPETHHHRIELSVGLKWMTAFLEGVAAASLAGLQELDRLRETEKKGRLLGATKRSRLPDAVDALLRTSVVTVRSLAETLDVTPQASLGLLRQLRFAGNVREASGRASWRAFALA
jgi:hypothetical protein